jgi:hypothetical protein
MCTMELKLFNEDTINKISFEPLILLMVSKLKNTFSFSYPANGLANNNANATTRP